MNRVKDILREGGVVVGAAAFPSDDVAFLAGSGFDFSRCLGEGGRVKVSQMALKILCSFLGGRGRV